MALIGDEIKVAKNMIKPIKLLVLFLPNENHHSILETVDYVTYFVFGCSQQFDMQFFVLTKRK